MAQGPGYRRIEAEVLFSSPTRQLYSISEEPFQRAIFNSYNAWLHEFCSYNPERLIGLATSSSSTLIRTPWRTFPLRQDGFSRCADS